MYGLFKTVVDVILSGYVDRPVPCLDIRCGGNVPAGTVPGDGHLTEVFRRPLDGGPHVVEPGGKRMLRGEPGVHREDRAARAVGQGARHALVAVEVAVHPPAPLHPDGKGPGGAVRGTV